ncbi:hypothetical protein COW36_13920 [bacterium (Candidatus Blackallbacteria) CG17_big_fil_post_rev_8_21_14_2_50_48_46]|uniref:Uncharacterized protein n=1 Tax=bacterium (Candidatus Blackallbacteria) CG17_big_fil_post_rev_8_21_14_2_50_48_46 TaxID=2014261 RepID=A0A2M7G320_9BACT|nr:MAG: hypothetical protein COW36_13920 [bacterium (Candidatus Blackallbacteria) CG17_big_fil_post_rev_8_21_14_2_50_48_46]PIW49893.1 MAG: hypothetical protein COW20_04385 [bacterium (Candidatus Blackallbacteria) CG13_big_fil_rev_8_21_14_2_50_49_14]
MHDFVFHFFHHHLHALHGHLMHHHAFFKQLGTLHHHFGVFFLCAFFNHHIAGLHHIHGTVSIILGIHHLGFCHFGMHPHTLALPSMMVCKSRLNTCQQSTCS